MAAVRIGIVAAMKTGHGAVMGALGGVLVTLAIVYVPQSGAADLSTMEPTSAIAIDASSSLPTAAFVPGPSIDLTPITNRLDEVNERLRALEARFDAVAVSQQRTAAAGSSVLASIDADSLQQAMVEIERRKFDAMSDDALRQMAWQAMQKGGDVNAAVQGLGILLERSKTPEQRAQVLIDLGTLQRMQGGEHGLTASVKSLQTVLDEQGIESKFGLGAARELVWTCSAQKDHAAALRFAESIVRSARATADQRIHARWAAAMMVGSLGDTNRARADYQSLLREIEGLPNYEKLVEDIRGRLNKK